jgi:site-specific DNA recombinase
MRVVVYARISRDEEGDALGVERQVKDCLARVNREGWHVEPDDIIVENDVGASARSRKPRPKFEAMMQAAESGLVDVIVAYSNSRLTRRPKELERLIDAHDRTGARFVTVVSGDDDLSTADGRMTARIKGNVDAAESERLGERVRRQKRERVSNGMSASGGVRPFGYTADRLHVVDSEASAIQDAAHRILAGESIVRVVEGWNAAGEPASVRGTAWTVRSLSGILRSPRITGLVEHNGRIAGEAQWPAILDRDTWEDVRAALTRPGKGKHSTHLLSGLLYCGECGTKLVAAGGRYRCNRAPGKTGGGCGRVSRADKVLEEYVLDQWAEHAEQVTGSPVFIATETYEEPDVQIEREEIERRIEVTRHQYAAGAIGDDAFPMIAELRTRLDTLGRSTGPRLPSGEPITEATLRVPWRMIPGMLALRGDAQQAIITQRDYLRRYIAKVTVGPVSVKGSKRFDPSTVSIEWR